MSSPRSRSPARNTGDDKATAAIPVPGDGSSDDPNTWADQVWDTVCPKLDEKLGGFTGDVKQVVNTLVGKQVQRLEKKIDFNQQTINTNIKNLEK